MARKLRVQYPGAVYHVLNRGDRREPKRHESEEAKAEDLLAAELKRRGWTRRDLQTRRKGDKEKVAMAGRLRRESTMTLKWLAERLAMGSWTNVSNLLAARRRAKR